MSGEEESGSYSGLMIGLMIAGGIVVLLILLAVLAMGSWFFLDVGGPGPGPGPAKPPPVAMVEEKMPAVPAEANQKPPNQRLLGSWEGTAADGGRFTLHFKEDGKLEIEAWRRDDPKKLGTTTRSRWTIVAADETLVKLRNDLMIFDAEVPGTVHELQFEGDNRFTVRSGIFAGNPARLGGCAVDGLTFRRLQNTGALPK